MTFRLLSLSPLFLASLPLSLPPQITVDQPIPAVATVNVDASRDAGAHPVQPVAVNDVDNPLRLIPVHTVNAVHAGALHHIVPHESVTAITFHKAT